MGGPAAGCVQEAHGRAYMCGGAGGWMLTSAPSAFGDDVQEVFEELSARFAPALVACILVSIVVIVVVLY